MITVEEIKSAVTQLPRNELTRFRSWFQQFDAEVWDQQFAEDAKSGRLDSLAEEALQDLREGNCTNL